MKKIILSASLTLMLPSIGLAQESKDSTESEPMSCYCQSKTLDKHSETKETKDSKGSKGSKEYYDEDDERTDSYEVEFGTCVCPDGSISNYKKVYGTVRTTQTQPSFREVRGQ